MSSSVIMEEDSTKTEFEATIDSSDPQQECIDLDGADPQEQLIDTQVQISEVPIIPTDEADANQGILTKINLTESFRTEQLFESREQIIAWCQELGKNTGSVIVILRSVLPAKGKKGRLYLGCERGGSFRIHKKITDQPKDKKADQSKENLVRKRKRELVSREVGTKKCNCPFELRAVTIPDGKWKLEVHCGDHNHELGQTSVGHSFVGRLNKEEREILIDMSKSGIKPKEVFNIIKQRSRSNMSTMRTIYNARASLKLKELEGKTSMQQLLKLLTEHRYVHWSRMGDVEADEVADVFWAHPESIQLAKCFPTVLILDCTYKTNRFKMPLLEIFGVTSTNKTFTVAFVFLKAEKEENYSWALSCLKNIFYPASLPSVFVTDTEMELISATSKVFPDAYRLVCTSQMMKSVRANCKEFFQDNAEFEDFLKHWTKVSQAESHDKFTDRWSSFELSWSRHQDCLKYIRENYLSLKEHFVLAWTNTVKHFGNSTTNRAEGAHMNLKDIFESSQGNFNTFWDALHNNIQVQINELKDSFETSLCSVLHSHQLVAFKELRGYVSHHALNLMLLEHNRSEEVGVDISSCGCVLRPTHGLPCAHEIVQFSREDRPIPLSEIDPQWKKLRVVLHPEEHAEADYLPELQLFRRKWENASEVERQYLVEKLREIVTPATTSLPEPSDSIIASTHDQGDTPLELCHDISNNHFSM